MGQALLSVIMAFLGNSMLNIGQATQKIGLEKFNRRKFVGSLLWVIGTLSMTGATLIIMYAVSLGNVSIVGAMAGAGLASLTIFSRFVMKEKVGSKEVIGVAIIFVSAVLIGAFAGEEVVSEVLLKPLYIFFGIVCVIYITGWLSFRKKHKFSGIIIGAFAGALGGFVPVFQKVATSEIGKSLSFVVSDEAVIAEASTGSQLIAVLTNPFALFWIFLSVVSMLVLQFAYKKDDAIRIIPAFAVNYILIPVLSGLICFNEKLHPIQWTGIFFILVGVAFITLKIKSKGEKN
jgi:drug/metabolite transporter (DMT)-like permease